MAQKKRGNNKSDSRDSKKGKFDMNPFNFIEFIPKDRINATTK